MQILSNQSANFTDFLSLNKYNSYKFSFFNAIANERKIMNEKSCWRKPTF